jgi:hypothetical protein
MSNAAKYYLYIFPRVNSTITVTHFVKAIWSRCVMGHYTYHTKDPTSRGLALTNILRRHDIQHKNTQHNETDHNDTAKLHSAWWHLMLLLSAFMPSVTIKSIMVNVVMLNVVMLNVVMLNVIMLNVVMLNVLASTLQLFWLHCLVQPIVWVSF